MASPTPSARLERRRSSTCRACPRLVAWREEVARDEAGVVPRRGVLGPPGARLRRPARPAADRRARARGARREPDRPGVHRRPVGRLALRVAAPDRVREPADVGRRATTASSCTDAYISAAVRCAPPANKPTPEERDRCRPYLDRELELLDRVRVIVTLGAFGYEALWAALARRGRRAAEAAADGSATCVEVADAAGHDPRLLPPEPAEHVHRQAHRADDSTRCSPAARELTASAQDAPPTA